MKKLVVYVILLFVISACNKEEVENTKFIGKWKIDQVGGGISGSGYDPGFKYLNFVNDNDCNWKFPNDITVEGKYSLSEKDGKDYIKFESGNDTLIYNFMNFELKYDFLSTDTLYMDQGCCDLYDFLFVKEN